jgi:glycine oxidase
MLEVVVVGGGLAGATVALHLAGRGAKVNLVEAEQPGSAATGAAGGMLAPQYEAAGPGALFRVLVQSRDYYPEFADAVEALSGEKLRLNWDGILVASFDEEEELRSRTRLEWQRAAGQEGEILDTAAATRLQPGITDEAVSYLWLPREGQVDSQQLAVLLPRVLRAAGVQVLGNRRVRDVQIQRDTIVGVELTDDRRMAADAVVVAAGAWSAIVERLPFRIPVRPVRGHLLRFAAGAVSLGQPIADQQGRFLIPRADGTVLAGSSMEEAGFDRSVDAEAVRAIHEAAARLVPALGTKNPTESWADLRPMTADGLPIIGSDAQVRGLFYAAGYGRIGILFSPLAGRVVADLILGGDLPVDWQGFTPGRLTSAGADLQSLPNAG